MSMLNFSQAFKVNKKTCDRKETFSSFPQSQINKWHNSAIYSHLHFLNQVLELPHALILRYKKNIGE